MSLAYRIDNRSIEQFTKEIKESHEIERNIIDAYCQYVKETYGMDLVVEENGVDNSGEFIAGKVTTDADFLINGAPVEVKFNKNMLSVFHLKVSQVWSYLKQNATILWVNGYETENPVFTLITPPQIKKMIIGREQIHFEKWRKRVYRFYANEFTWKSIKIGGKKGGYLQ